MTYQEVNRQNRSSLLPMFITLGVMIAGVLLLVITAPEATVRDRFLVVPFGWLRFLIGFILLTGGIGLSAYFYGKATRPGKANDYAISAATHIFMIVVVLLAFYPIIYLLSVSFNRNDALAGALPREGNLLTRSGVLPDPSEFSFVQYQKVLSQTHILGYQWILIAIAVLALVAVVVTSILKRNSSKPYQLERWRAIAGWTIFGSLAVLIVSVNPSQFYSVNASGERVAPSSERMIVLYIRNTLLVSGITGLFAVLISTTAGYAFARFKFEGRYGTLLTFVFVQMFPNFMALVAIYYLMTAIDLFNTFPGLILAYSGGAIAFASWIFKGYLESISPSLEEAALVDGTTRWGAFWRVILPISIPMLLFIFLLQFIGTYSEFILANTLLQDNTKWTVGMGLRNFANGRFDTQWGALAASAVLGSIPIVVIFYAFQDALTGQYTEGGVKG
jgi:arabinogalactan oligomer / maltooligosaccharide transport system permease protein